MALHIFHTCLIPS